jgi:uncharacterized protein (TIGR00290 family)
MDTIFRFLNWSGGKDAAIALWELQKKGIKVNALLTTYNEQSKTIPLHEIPINLIEAQANALRLPLIKIGLPTNCSNETYDNIMMSQLGNLAPEQQKIAVFGDIFLEDIRAFRKQQLSKLGIETSFPLWQSNTKALAETFIKQGFKAIICSANAKILPKNTIGKIFDKQFLASLPPEVDPCGENGEFHSFVFDGPIFEKPLAFPAIQDIKSIDYGKPNSGYDQRFYYAGF